VLQDGDYFVLAFDFQPVLVNLLWRIRANAPPAITQSSEVNNPKSAVHGQFV